MDEDKSSRDEKGAGGRGVRPEGEGKHPSQQHLFYNTEPLWDVLEVKQEKTWNEGLKIFDSFVTYVHTQPKNWVGPEVSSQLPWEE